MLIAVNPDGTIQALQTVTYWLTSQHLQTVESSPTFYSVPTPQFTQNAIDQYNQDAPFKRENVGQKSKAMASRARDR